MARLSSELLLTLTDRVSGPARRVGGALDTLDRKTHRMGGGMAASTRGIDRLTASVGAYGAAALGAAAVPLGAGLGASEAVKAAADFETALTNIQKKAGTTTAETAKIGEEVKALATSGDLAVPIADILSAYERGAAAGIPIAELKEFAALSVKAADGFEMSAEDVGNFAAKLKTGLKMTGQEVRNVFDLTNSLADAGIADESKLVDFMDRTGASLKTLGLTYQQTLALGATLLNVGMQSEVASTGMGALSSKILTVNTLTGKSRKTFERYMGPVSKFSKMVETDANGAMLMLLDTVGKLDKTQRMDFLKSFVGAEWADEMLRLVEATDEYRRNLELAGDTKKWVGSLDSAYALKLDDFWSQWQVLKNELQELSIDVGTAGLPALKEGLAGVRTTVNEIGKGFEAFGKELDWTEIGEAKAAVVDLGTAVSALLDIKTTDCAIPQFFREMAGAVNDVATGIKAVDGFMKALANPAEAMGLNRPPPKTEDEAAARTYEGLKKRVRADYEKREGMKQGAIGSVVPDWMIGDRPSDMALNEYQAANWDRALEDVKREIRDERARAPKSEPAERGGRIAAEGGGTVDGGPVTRRPADEVAAPSARPVPVPSPRPAASSPAIDLLAGAPAKAEEGMRGVNAAIADGGATAEAKAGEIGGRITSAFDVTARPTVDTGSIDAAAAKVDALSLAIGRLGSQSVRAVAPAVAGGGSAPKLDGKRAAGGPVKAGGLYEVNERGQELSSPGVDGHVLNARDSAEMMRGGGASAPAGKAPSFAPVINATTTINVTGSAGQDPVKLANEIERRVGESLKRQLRGEFGREAARMTRSQFSDGGT